MSLCANVVKVWSLSEKGRGLWEASYKRTNLSFVSDKAECSSVFDRVGINATADSDLGILAK